MKPLELTVYPLDDRFPAGYTMPRNSRISFRAANSAAQAKRLSEAQLMAHVWWTISEFYILPLGPEAQEIARQSAVFERFAQLPHYDEVTL